MHKWANCSSLSVPNYTLLDQKLKLWPIFEANFGQKSKFDQFWPKFWPRTANLTKIWLFMDQNLVKISNFGPAKIVQNPIWDQLISVELQFWVIPCIWKVINCPFWCSNKGAVMQWQEKVMKSKYVQEFNLTENLWNRRKWSKSKVFWQKFFCEFKLFSHKSMWFDRIFGCNL